jgi:hypothetical protein
MGFFSKKEEEIPEFPRMSSAVSQRGEPQQNNFQGAISSPPISEAGNSNQNNTLPSFPNSNFGEKMNQNTVKEAVGYDGNEANFNESNFETRDERYSPPMREQDIPRYQDNSNHMPVRTFAPIHYRTNLNSPPVNAYPNPSAKAYSPPQTNHPVRQQPGYGTQNPQPFRTVESNQYEEEFEEEQPMMMPVQNQNILSKQEKVPRGQRVETLFIQLDSFEKTIATFDEVKIKLSEIESLLGSIKETRRKEEEKLAQWETEIMKIKNSLDEIDRNFFNI